MEFTALIFSAYNSDIPYEVFDVTQSVVFSTQLHGGFSTATFNLLLNSSRAYNLFDYFLGNKVVIVDRYYRVVYEGEVNNLSTDGSVFKVGCIGYYSKAGTVIDDRIYPTAPVTVKDVVEDACGLIDAWNYNAAYISNATYDLMITDPDTGADLALDFTDKKVQDAVESVLSYGYSSSDTRPPFIALWEERIPHLFVKERLSEKNPDWILTQANLGGTNPTRSVTLDNVFNSVFAIYANEGSGQSKTTVAQDDLSIARFGQMDGVVQNGGNPEGLAMAEDLRDYALTEYAWPIPTTALTATGDTKTWYGASDYLYQIRAGDIVFVDTGDPTAILYPNTPDSILAKARLFVVGTTYTASSNSLQIVVGSTDTDFTVLMSRLGLSGGLR